MVTKRILVGLIMTLTLLGGLVSVDALTPQADAATCKTATSQETNSSALGFTILKLNVEVNRCYASGSFTSYSSWAACTGGNGFGFDKWVSYQPKAEYSSTYARSYYHCQTTFTTLWVTQTSEDNDGWKVWGNGTSTNYI